MTDPRNPPITLELPGYLIDTLADWARADAQAHAPATVGTERRPAREERAALADAFMRSVLHYLPDLADAGDLAAALSAREVAYDEHRAANPQ